MSDTEQGLTDAEALAAVERSAYSAVESGFEAVVEAAVAAEDIVLRSRPRHRRLGIEAAVEDLVGAIATEAFGPLPERFERAQRAFVRERRAGVRSVWEHEQGSRLLQEAEIIAPVHSGDARNERHGYWLDEAGLWRQLESLFSLDEVHRQLSEPSHGPDAIALDKVLTHARGLAGAMHSLLEHPRALRSVLHRFPTPAAAARPKPARPDGRKENAAASEDVERAAKMDAMANIRDGAELLAVAARQGLIKDGDTQGPSADRRLLSGLKDAFEMYTGRLGTFSRETETQRRPSECIMFVQAAYRAFGREPPKPDKLISDSASLEKPSKRPRKIKYLRSKS